MISTSYFIGVGLRVLYSEIHYIQYSEGNIFAKLDILDLKKYSKTRKGEVDNLTNK